MLNISGSKQPNSDLMKNNQPIIDTNKVKWTEQFNKEYKKMQNSEECYKEKIYRLTQRIKDLNLQMLQVEHGCSHTQTEDGVIDNKFAQEEMLVDKSWNQTMEDLKDLLLLLLQNNLLHLMDEYGGEMKKWLKPM
jgi:hypothetical protein